jgi:hypothetical protein
LTDASQSAGLGRARRADRALADVRLNDRQLGAILVDPWQSAREARAGASVC